METNVPPLAFRLKTRFPPRAFCPILNLTPEKAFCATSLQPEKVFPQRAFCRKLNLTPENAF